MRNIVNQMLGWFGLEIHRPTLPSLQSAIFTKYGVDCVVDIGANVGQFGKSLRSWGYRGPIVSFEPLPSAYAQLVRASLNDEDWSCHNFAVGPTEGEVLINEAKFTSVSSFLSPTETYDRLFKADRGSTKETNVTMTSLARALDSAQGHRLFLKTDTQGYDMEVLRSADDLSRIVAIQCEMSLVPLYEGSTPFLAAVAEIEEFGFVPSGFFPIVRDGRDLRLIEIDGIFVRDGRPVA